MLPANPTETRPRPVCVVVTDTSPLTPDSPHAGGDAHYLLATGAASRTVERWRRAGIHVHRVEDFPPPPPFRVRNLYTPSTADRSDDVRHALAHLHAEYRFVRIEFGLLGGLAFRPLQARRAGLTFAGVEIVVGLDECSQRLRERAERWPASIDDIELDYAERCSLEWCDATSATEPSLVEYVRRLRWHVPAAIHHGVRNEIPAEVSPAPLVTIGVAHYNLGRYLPDTLASIAAQTYTTIEVIIIDDGSTDESSRRTLDALTLTYPQFHFKTQPNAGIGATRNRCLSEARGEYFIPMDADNIARPDMVERFVAAIARDPDSSAMSCYYLAFDGDKPFPPDDYLFAVRPAAGPLTLSCIRNVYGDANAVFRTADFRAAGGYETDRGTSCEDWEAFVKLVFAGKNVGVVPDHLFYYRHRAEGFSRVTNWFANHQRVLRQFTRADHPPAGEAAVMWPALLGFQQRVGHLESRLGARRYRVADALHAAFRAATWPARKMYTTARRYLITRS